MTLPLEQDLERLRELGGHEIRILLRLDISSEEYVRSGERGSDVVLVVEPELSSALYQRILTAVEAGEAHDLNDEASRGLALFISVGIDRHAFMAPLMEALAGDTHRGRGGSEDPLHGYPGRVDALEKGKEAS